MNILKKINYTFLTILLLGSVFAFTGQPEEYIIKGVLLEKISTFIEWPDEAIANSKEDKFVIGIMGKHKFGQVLQDIYSKRKIQNKELVVKYVSSLSEINNCRAVFIPKLTENELKEILDFLKKKPILTLADTDGYAEKGVHINFYTEENNIRFEINEKSVKESGINMNHLLLSLAKLVGSEK